MWYSVNLLYKSLHPEHPEHEWLWEERIVLVEAGSEDEAKRKGERLGKAEEVEYISATGDLVRWTFQQLERVCQIEALQDGSELFSRFLSQAEVDSLTATFKE
jgi:hypothetical protein